MLLVVMIINLLCVDDKSSKSFKSCIGEDVLYSFISSMIL